QQNDLFFKTLDEILAVSRVANVANEKILSALNNNSELLASSCESRSESNVILQRQVAALELIVDAMTSIYNGSKDIYSVLDIIKNSNENIPETLASIDTGILEFRESLDRFISNSEKNKHDYLVKIKKIIEVLNND
ncbi:hypothetical protein DLN99_24315, partial [Salmonella enterica]|nr:hypothetical protein [Salmonella enterica]